MFSNESNNYCEISGRVIDNPEFSHEVSNEKFYKFGIEVKRLSGTNDCVNVLMSERHISDSLDLNEDSYVYIKGQFRSFNNYSGIGNKLILSVFVKEIYNIYNEEEYNKNSVILTGFLCKEPVYRVTPFGREITDILLAVNRIHNKSDYIPCIIWGRNAKEASAMTTGNKIKIYGRIQSRDYKKKLENDEIVNKTAFEISVSKLEKEEEEY